MVQLVAAVASVLAAQQQVMSPDFSGYKAYQSTDVVGVTRDNNILCYGQTTSTQPLGRGCDATDTGAGNFPASITLQICDTFSACGGLNGPPNNCIKSFGQFSSGNTTYLSLMKCAMGVKASNVSSITGHTYKFCANAGDVDLHLSKTFDLPPFLCEQTCSNDESCEGFQVDGQMCFTLSSKTTSIASEAYFRLE